MDINTLAAWGEFLGGIAVLASLLYLAGQVRQTSRLLRASTASASAQIQEAQNTLVAQDPEVARIQLQGYADRDSLSEVDQRRLDSLLFMQMKGHNQRYRFHREGLDSNEAWESHKREIMWMARQPGIRQWWAAWRDLFDDAFCELFDGLIREGEAAG